MIWIKLKNALKIGWMLLNVCQQCWFYWMKSSYVNIFVIMVIIRHNLLRMIFLSLILIDCLWRIMMNKYQFAVNKKMIWSVFWLLCTVMLGVFNFFYFSNLTLIAYRNIPSNKVIFELLVTYTSNLSVSLVLSLRYASNNPQWIQIWSRWQLIVKSLKCICNCVVQLTWITAL